MNYHITKEPYVVCLNTSFQNVFLQRAWQLITLSSLAISILYIFLPSFSELTNWIAVVILGTVPVILITPEFSKVYYLSKQVSLNRIPSLLYSRKIHLMLTLYNTTTQPSNRDTFFVLNECSQLVDLSPCQNKQYRVWRHTILLLDGPEQPFNTLVNTQ